MLAPKRVKFRKWQKGRLRGPALRGATIAFGDIGLKTVEHGKLTNQQIEAARIAMMRHIKRGGKVWIRVCVREPLIYWGLFIVWRFLLLFSLLLN